MQEFLQALVSGLLIGGVYGLFSIGLTLIFGVMRLINFAHGDFIMVGMYLTFVMYTFLHMHIFLAILVVVPIMFCLGFLLEKLFEIVIGDNDLPQVVLTVALSMLLQTLVLMIFSPNLRSIDTPYGHSYFNTGSIIINQAQLIAFVTALASSLGLSQFLNRTDLGKAMRATVDDREMALMVGINFRRIYVVAVGLGIALAGLSGGVILTYYPLFPTVGLTFLCLAFVTIVLGGMGNVMGAFVGGLLIGVIQQISAVFFPVDLQNAVLFILFVLILLIRPHGLMGKEGVL